MTMLLQTIVLVISNSIKYVKQQSYNRNTHVTLTHTIGQALIKDIMYITNTAKIYFIRQ